MKRKEEYDVLMQELEEVPIRLNYTLTRARAKVRRRNLRRWVGAPLTTLSAVCVAFVLMVNLSMPFAMACARVPFLRDLAKAVSFSPSLSAAVENRWVQIIDQTDTDGDYTMTVEYVIVDQKQLNVFYSVEGIDLEKHYQPRVDVLDGSRMEMKGFSILMPDVNREGELSDFTIDYTGEEDMPGDLRLTCELFEYDETERRDIPVANFEFHLQFDPQFTAAGQAVEVNEWIELNGQRICLTDVEIYPTHARVNFDQDPNNTAWLSRLELYAEDANGVRYDGSNGISATGDPNHPGMTSYRLNSSYFSESKHLTVYITGADWLTKEEQWIWVDVSTGESAPMPEWLTWTGSERDGEDLCLYFRVYKGTDRLVPQLIQSWRVAGGEKQYFSSFGISTAWDTEKREELENYSDIRLVLEDCSWDRVELELGFTESADFTAPIAVEIS